MASDVIPAGMSGKENGVAITAQAALNAPLASNSAHTETAASQGATTPEGRITAHPLNGISDPQFNEELEKLRRLREFVVNNVDFSREKLSDDKKLALFDFGVLNSLHYAASGDERARDASPDEWNLLERHMQALLSELTPEMKEQFSLVAHADKIAMDKITASVARYAWWCAIVAVLSVIAGMLMSTKFIVTNVPVNTGGLIFVFYCFWLIALGAMGAIAFIGINFLSIEKDMTFNPLSRELVSLRIIIGSLFALTLSLPYGFENFYQFCVKTMTYNPLAQTVHAAQLDSAAHTNLSMDAVTLVLPFVLGFSTPLVILILNRFVAAVQGFFGSTSEPGSGPRPASRTAHSA